MFLFLLEMPPVKMEEIRPDDETLTSKDPPLPPPADYKDIAAKLFREEFVLIEPEEYTQFLAALDNESAVIREHYMDMFTWDANLLALTRMLCLKLYLKGESQEIDRILSAFTKLYLKQHPSNVFSTGDFEQIYIVLYSLILLNTALHNGELAKTLKISQTDYIRNTVSTFQQSKKGARALLVRQKIRIERELQHYYEDLARHELYLKRADTPRRTNKRYSVAETIMSHESRPEGRPERHGDEARRANTSARHANTDPSGNTGTTNNTSASTNNTNTNNTNTNNTNTNNTNNTDNTNANTNANANTTNIPHDTASTDARDPNGLPPYSVHEAPSHMHANHHANLDAHLLGEYASSIAPSGSSDNDFGRPSLAVQRTASAMSGASALSTPRARFGFTRALHSEATPAGLLRNYRSLDHLGALRTVSRRTSRTLMVTAETAPGESVSTVSAEDFPLWDLPSPGGDKLLPDDFDAADYQDQVDLKLELQGAPYLKEGLLRLRILHNDLADLSTTADQAVVQAVNPAPGRFFSFFNRSFRASEQQSPMGTGGLFSGRPTEYFVVVSKGELRLYLFDPKVVKKQHARRKKLHKHADADEEDEEESERGDGNWLKNAANVGNYNLCATAARHEKPDAGSGRFAWSLTFPKVSKHQPKKFIFEAGTSEVAAEFVDTCNFWAAKISAIPALEESVSSIEYGWNDVDALLAMGDSFKRTKRLLRYEPIPKGVYLSSYVVQDSFSHDGMLQQFMLTLRYYNNLKHVYATFSQTKARFMAGLRKQARCSNYKLAVTNFDTRASEYKAELGRYKNYLQMLAQGLRLRFNSEAEEDIESWKAELAQSEPPLTEDQISTEIQRRLAERLDTESDLTRAVRNEIAKRMATEDEHAREELTPLVKSPKTFSFTNIKDSDVSPIGQLLSVDGKPDGELHQVKKELILSFSTNTITEEEEPEDERTG